MKAVIHLPERQEDAQKLMRAIARFRADQTRAALEKQGMTAERMTRLFKEISAEQAGKQHETRRCKNSGGTR